MVRIKSIIDVVTNSSSEVFLIKDSKKGLTWKEILNVTVYPFTRDNMMGLLENFFGVQLKNKPVKGCGLNMINFQEDNWENLEHSWRNDEVQDLWKSFVEENKESFRKLLNLRIKNISDEDLPWEDFARNCNKIRKSSSLISDLGRNGNIEDIAKYNE